MGLVKVEDSEDSKRHHFSAGHSIFLLPPLIVPSTQPSKLIYSFILDTPSLYDSPHLPTISCLQAVNAVVLVFAL